MTGTAQLIVLLIVSVILTFVVGQLLVRAGEPFLSEVFRDKAVTRSVNLLLSVLFYLITLGVLAIISIVDIGKLQDQPLQSFVLRLGIVLLVLGVAYGISCSSSSACGSGGRPTPSTSTSPRSWPSAASTTRPVTPRSSSPDPVRSALSTR